MKQFIKTYWRRALFYAVLITFALLFTKEDYDHYLHSDYKAFLPASHTAFITLLAVWLCIILFIGRKHIEGVKHALSIVLFLAVKFAILYFFFHVAFTGCYLFINRQYHGAPIARRFMVRRDSLINNPYYIESVSGDNLYLATLFANYPIPNTHKPIDTITIPFTKGLFGVPYLEKSNGVRGNN